jgi:thymidylate kinase
MKIAISGAHGQGKTTILNSLRHLSVFKDYVFVDSPTRTLQANYLINENGTQDTQVSIMYKHYVNVMTNGNNIILDRCALDGISYSTYFKSKIDAGIFSSLQQMYLFLMKQYDIVFYINPELKLTSDGVRSLDVGFFNDVKNTFENLIEENKHNVTRLSGSNEQRIATILNTLKL